MPFIHSRSLVQQRIAPSLFSRLTRRTPSVLAVTAAVLLPGLSYGQGTGGRTVTYTGLGTNDNLQVVTAWPGNNAAGVPDWSDNEGTGLYRFAGTDSIIFPSLASLSPAGQTRLNPILAVTNNNNLGATTYTLRALSFEEGSGGYTFTGATGISLALGDSTDPLANSQNTGILLNSSLSTQVFNLPVKFRFGSVDAAAGPIVFGQTLNVGNNLADAANNLTVTGASSVTVTGALLGNGTDSSLGGALIKEGSGALILNGNNAAWNGRILVNEGAVVVGSGTALGSVSGRTTLAGDAATGRLQFATLNPGTTTIAENFYLGGRSSESAPHLVNASGNFDLAGRLVLEDGGTEYGLRSDAGRLSVSGGIVYGGASGSANLRLGGAGDGLIVSNLGTGAPGISVVKEGGGTWTLSGANSYTGATRVNGGRLNISTAQTGGGDISIGDLSTLGVSLGASGQTLKASSFSLGSGVGGSLAFDLGNSGTPTVPLITTPRLITAGTSTITLAAGGLSLGLVPLIDYSGTIEGRGFAGLSLSGLPARVTAVLVNDTVNTKISINVTAFDLPRWTGSVNGNWDINNGINPAVGSGTQNWKELNSGNVTRYLQSSGTVDSVRFDDSATGTTDVILAAVLSPTTATVNNSTLAYTFSGPGKLSGATNLLKQGSGTLTLANVGGNDYTGTTTVSGGVLRIGDGITPGGGQLGSGQVINEAAIAFNRPAGDSFVVSSPISGAGALIKLGDNVATLSGASTFDGAVTAKSGTLRLGHASALGSVLGGTTVENGAALDVGDFQTPAGEVITIRGNGGGPAAAGALINSGPVGGAFAGVRNLVLAGDASVGGSKRFDVRDGSLNAAGFTLTKTGANTVYLASLGETHLGSLVISTGRVSFEGNTTFGDQPGAVQVEIGGDLGFENSTVTQAKTIELNGGRVIFNTGTANAVSGQVTLAGGQPGSFQGPLANVAATLGLSGAVTGGGALTKTQFGTLVLSGLNSYSGGTAISGGTVQFDTAASVPAAGLIALGANTGVNFGFEVTQTLLAGHLAPTSNPAAIGLGASSAASLDLASYPNASLGAYAKATYSGKLTAFGTAAGGTYRLGGGGGELTFTTALSGNNALAIGSGGLVGPAGFGGTVILTAANSFTGGTNVFAGHTLVLGNAAALGPATNALTVNGTLDLNGNSLSAGSLSSAQTPATVLITDNAAGPGTSVLTNNAAAGVSTTFGGTVKDGSNGRALALVKAGQGTLILNGANSGAYTGGTVLAGGRLDVRTNNAQVLPLGGSLSVTGTSTLSASNNSNNAAVLVLGTLALNGGEGTVESNNFNGGTGSARTTFAAVPVRANGATGNFTLANAATPTALPSPATYRVTFTAAPVSGQSLNGGLFFGGDQFAAYDDGGYVRPLAYATDPGAFDVPLTEDQPGFGVAATGRDVQIGGGIFSITSQPAESLRSLRLAGANNLILNAGATLTITSGGLIKAGGNAATISGGDALTSGGAGDLVIRTALSTDALTIATSIPASTAGGLTKAGPGSLTLTATNSFLGGVSINGGSVRFASLAAVPATGDIRLNQGATVSFAHPFDQAFLQTRVPGAAIGATIALGAGNANDLDFNALGAGYAGFSLGATGAFTYSGRLTPNAGAYRLGGGGGTLTYSGELIGHNALIIGGSGSGGTVVLSAANSYDGGTTVTAGTLRLGNAGALGSGNASVAVNGGTLDLRGFNQTLTDFSGTGNNAIVTDNSPSAGTTTLSVSVAAGVNTYNGSINNGTGGRVLKLVKDGAGGLILNKGNGHSYTGGTLINAGRLEVRTNNAQVLANGSSLSFAGSGTFAAVNNGDATVSTAGLTLGALTLLAGDAVIESSQINASTSNRLTFTAAPARSAGATGNFTLSVASDPALYKVVFTNPAAGGQSVNGGLFFNYSDFLAYDGAGYARALRYTGAPDLNTAAIVLAGNQATLGSGLAGKDLQIGGNGGFAITAQPSESIRTLRLAGDSSLALGAGQTLVLTGGGLIKTGGGASTISGGAGIAGDGVLDLVANVDLGSDTLTISTPILAGAGAVTKTGLGTLNLNGVQAHGALYANAGTTNVYTAIGTGAAAVRALSIVNFNVNQKLAGLAIGASGAVALKPHAAAESARLIDAAELTIARGGRLDLTNNALVVRGGSLASITAQIAGALYGTGASAGGLWGGAGITSSVAAADLSMTHALGVLDNALAGFSEFAGATGLTGGEVLVKYTLFGDADLDGQITTADYALIDSNASGGGSRSGWVNGDFDYDGQITTADYALIDASYLSSTGSRALEGARVPGLEQDFQVAVVPEPGSLGLLAWSALGLLGRRWRNKHR